MQQWCELTVKETLHADLGTPEDPLYDTRLRAITAMLSIYSLEGVPLDVPIIQMSEDQQKTMIKLKPAIFQAIELCEEWDV